MMKILAIFPILLLFAVIIYIIRSHGNVNKMVVSIVSILLIVTTLIPFLDLDDNITSHPDVVVYDDYVSDVESATGVFEILTVDNKTIAHAKDIGSGTITFTDGTTKSYDVGKANLDVIMLIGQSNAAYFRYTPGASSPVPDLGQSYYFGNEYQAIYWGDGFIDAPSYDVTYGSYSMYDMINPLNNEVRIGNIELPFAGLYTDKTDSKCYIINCGIISWSIDKFMPDQVGWNYAKATVNAAVNAIDTSKFNITGYDYLWIQGEADSGMPVDEYVTKFTTINDSFNDSSFGHVFDYGVISQTRPVDGVNSSEAQEIIASSLDDVILGSTAAAGFSMKNGMMLNDDLHYSQLGDNIIGQNLADALIKLNGGL